VNILERVRYSRNCTNDTFPLPSPTACLWYAFTEAGEVVDARLRLQQPEHVRNHARNDDPRREAGQAIYMLCSGYVQLHRNNLFTPWPANVGEPTIEFALAEACHRTVAAITDLLLGDENGITIILALQAWVHVCSVAGWDADQLIDETCAEFERKHCVVVAR